MKLELKADRWRKCLICILHQNLPKKITLRFRIVQVFTCLEGVYFYQRKILKPIFINQSCSSQRCSITSNLGFYTCCLQQEFYVYLILHRLMLHFSLS
ncbi:hypothetical protein CsSME_00043759 [Camellia sinensis var. sinensis]